MARKKNSTPKSRDNSSAKVTDRIELMKIENPGEPDQRIPHAARPVFGINQHFHGREHDEEKARQRAEKSIARPTGPDGEPNEAVAALQLGYWNTILTRQTALLLDPYIHKVMGLVNGIPHAILEIERATGILAHLTIQEAIVSLQKVVESNRSANATLVNLLEDEGTEARQLDVAIRSSNTEYKKLGSASDRYLPRNHALRPIYDLGVEIARFEILVSESVASEG